LSETSLPRGYQRGTHRLVPPEATLARIRPHLGPLGVTRCADVTGLDRLGIPVSCSIRPRGVVLQVSNGKGLRRVDARVSALMEAIELDHMEHPRRAFRRASLKELRRAGERAIEPRRLPEYRRGNFFSEDYVIDWVRSDELVSGRSVLLPASSIHLCSPMLFDRTGNGLASGNHIVEATLHAIYELLERDAVSRLVSDGLLRFTRRRARFIDLATLSGPVKRLQHRVRAAGVRLVLIRARAVVPVHAFMAVLLDPEPFSASSKVNLGYGAHLSASVAAARAITEAAQSRLTFIHGAREDLEPAAYRGPHRTIYDFFDAKNGDTDWQTLEELASADLAKDLRRLVDDLAAAGFRKIFRVDMTQPAFGIPVVRVIIPGLKFEDLF
jgi:ribosomal protein S12 methylthiotransferase accessory factor